MQSKRVGLRPQTIIDVGAAYGGVTSTCFDVFPDSNFLMLEALTEYTAPLEAVRQRIPNAKIVWAAVGKENGKTIFNVHKDLVGSSLYKETEGGGVDGTERTVPVVTLDWVCREEKTTGPYLIKIDVQGAELDVLRGAAEILPETECIFLEVSLFEFFKGGPQLFDVIFFMKECGFVCYDIFGFQYRLLDNALSQVDMVFVKEKGLFRSDHSYATREQRAAQDAQFIKIMENVLHP